MPESIRYPKRLIEVDLPIRRISVHARREKSIRHGHISTLHIWWARRPLAACRAVTCAALWPDPADPICPESFRDTARREMNDWATNHLGLLSPESYSRFNGIAKAPSKLDDLVELRNALLDFIADFSNWDSATVKEYLDTARALTQAAHEALGGAPGTRPLVVDPFAGGGSIPLEALRVGADAFASDLNPVPVLLNRVVLEYLPKYGQRLADGIQAWGKWIQKEAEKTLAAAYPTDPDGARPIAYIWARTISCEGPGCGAEIPLIRSLWLSKRTNRFVALQLVPTPDAKSINVKLLGLRDRNWIDLADPSKTVSNPTLDGTLRKGSATCPCCDYTTPNERVRTQLAQRRGGASSARLLAVVVLREGESGRSYRLPVPADIQATRHAVIELQRRVAAYPPGRLTLVPNEKIPTERPSPNARGLSAVTRMGVETFADLFTPRQALALTTFSQLVQTLLHSSRKQEAPGELEAVATCLALAVDRVSDSLSSLVRWIPGGEFQGNTFSRQALSIVWDFAECNPLADASGNWMGAVEWVARVVAANIKTSEHVGVSAQASATHHPLPDDSVAALITDPPYYDAVPYADLSEYFYVWLRRSLAGHSSGLLEARELPKDEEAIWNPSRIYSPTGKSKDERFYEEQMRKAFVEARRVVAPDGIGVVVFAHKSTAGWEAVLSALIEAGWIATGSWPIDTEREVRTNAIGTASLSSSVHIVCRPRENTDGNLRTEEVGDWREILRELPRRIHEWMPRLAHEGVVGADAIFACLGPALEVFSRYSRVEKATGEVVGLREYLEQVWAAVSKEALAMIFSDAETSGLEPDARLTAMWLWTLSASQEAPDSPNPTSEMDDEDEDDGSPGKGRTASFALEYDTARKIAQGLGARLEELTTVAEVKGDKARLLSVAERANGLFGKEKVQASPKKGTKRKQASLFVDLEEVVEEDHLIDGKASKLGRTALDRVHQAMLLFGAGRSEALKRFLTDQGVGGQTQFWKLAQALSALYPAGTDEKRWVDGVLARKKGLGFG